MKRNTLTLVNIGIFFITIILLLKEKKEHTLLMKVQNLEEDYENSINNWSGILANLKSRLDLIENRS